MGYSRSEETLKTLLPQLGDLVLGREQSWLCQPGMAHKFAYKIREALFIATLSPENRAKYPGLAQASERYSIVVDGDKVSTKIAANTSETRILTDSEHTGINQGYADHGRSIATSGRQSVFQVIEAWRKNAQQGNSNTPMHFVGAALPDNELFMLWEWAHKRTPTLMILVDGENLTLGPVERDVEAYAWKPAGVTNGSSTQTQSSSTESDSSLSPSEPAQLEGDSTSPPPKPRIPDNKHLL